MSKLGRYSADRKKIETLSASKTSPVFIDATAGDGDNIHGVGYCVTGSGADGGNFPDGTNGSGVDRITLHGGATSRIGDQVELVCDGTNWYATALAFNVNGITYD